MLIHAIKLTNFLSFGDELQPVSLKPLNVVIGPNGSGKSNLLESIDLLRSMPEQLLKPIREGGNVRSEQRERPGIGPDSLFGLPDCRDNGAGNSELIHVYQKRRIGCYYRRRQIGRASCRERV